MTKTSTEPSLEARGLTKKIGPRMLWQNLDLNFKPGTLTAITGTSGSGKTTLLNTLGLLDKPTSGQLRLEGQELTGLSQKNIRRLYRERIAFLFQNYALVEQWTVRANLNLALRALKTPRKKRSSLIEQTLHAVGLANREDSPVYTLSGGEQQRVAIARVIAHQPKLIFADEPTAALDQDNAQTVFDHLQAFADQGAIVVFTTHDSELGRKADQTLCL